MTDMAARRERSVEVLVVGAGPSGLATAEQLARDGLEVEVVDREGEPGGLPRHCHHTGFGARDLRRLLTGPEYAGRWVDRAAAAGARVRAGVTVTGWSGGLDGSVPPDRTFSLDTTSALGLDRVSAAAVVLATGARERPRPARWIPGDRPPGVWTTGELQRAVDEEHQPVGTRAVVVGAEHVSFSAALTLYSAGARIVAMVTEHERQQSYPAFRWAAAAGLRFPVVTGATVRLIRGRARVESVVVRLADGRERVLDCDTVVLTGDWVADHELARLGGLTVDPRSTAPSVDTRLRSTVPGVVAVGNLVHPVLTADLAAADAAVAARAVRAWVRDGVVRQLPSVGVAVGEPLRWVFPGRVSADLAAPPRDRFVVAAAEPRGRAVLEVRQGDRLLWAGRARSPVQPGRPVSIPGRWVAAVEVPGPEVVVTVH
jgi:thioredoxin reductase